MKLTAIKPAFWAKDHHLDRMTLRELVIAYFQYPAIMGYLASAMVAIGLWFRYPASVVQTGLSVGVAIVVYPLVWYCLHRWVLHSRWMFKVPLLASTWKRIHYDHHQDPNRLEILFGALHTTLPTIALATAPIGYLIGGPGGALAAFATGLIQTCVYEFFHCIQHLAYKPKRKWVMDMKARHMAHHFHDERGNFGITSYLWDKLLGTYYERIEKDKKSETVFNLGYTAEVAERYPHVARLSGGVATGHPSQRIPH